MAVKEENNGKHDKREAFSSSILKLILHREDFILIKIPYYGVLGYETVQSGRWLPAFWRKL
jgi:hypothetical protein